MKQILLICAVVALVGFGKDSRPAENADKHVGNKKEGGVNPSSEETKKEAVNAKLESTGKGGEDKARKKSDGSWTSTIIFVVLGACLICLVWQKGTFTGRVGGLPLKACPHCRAELHPPLGESNYPTVCPHCGNPTPGPRLQDWD